MCLFFLRLGMTSEELKGLHGLLQPLVDHKMDSTHKNYRLFVCCRWPRKKFDEKDTQSMLPLPPDFMSRSTRVFMREPTGESDACGLYKLGLGSWISVTVMD